VCVPRARCVHAPPAASVDELWRLVAALVSQLRTRLLPRARLGAGAQTLEDACALLSRAQSIVVVTGAGISVSAGIPDFRSANGVYALVESRFQLPDPQSLFDIHYFAHDPEPFFSFAKHLYPGAYRPTASHRFIKASKRGLGVGWVWQGVAGLAGPAWQQCGCGWPRAPSGVPELWCHGVASS
jgi:hypothetical protein